MGDLDFSKLGGGDLGAMGGAMGGGMGGLAGDDDDDNSDDEGMPDLTSA